MEDSLEEREMDWLEAWEEGTSGDCPYDCPGGKGRCGLKAEDWGTGGMKPGCWVKAAFCIPGTGGIGRLYGF